MTSAQTKRRPEGSRLIYPTSVEFFTDALCLRVFPLTGPAISRGANHRAFKLFDFVAKPNQICVKVAERLHASALHGLYGFHASLRQSDNRCCRSCRNQLLRGSFGNKIRSRCSPRLNVVGSFAMNLLLQA